MTYQHPSWTGLVPRFRLRAMAGRRSQDPSWSTAKKPGGHFASQRRIEHEEERCSQLSRPAASSIGLPPTTRLR